MSFQLPTRRPSAAAGSSRAGTAFLVEAMVLLVFLMASLAIFMQMFSAALTRADESARLTAAVAVASDTAERFAAYPSQAGGEEVIDGMRVVCDVQAEPRESGTLYRATISVYAADDADSAAPEAATDAQGRPLELITGEPVYSISTARFEGEVE